MTNRRKVLVVGAVVAAVALLVAVLFAMAAREPSAERATFAEQAPPAPLAEVPTMPGIAGLVDEQWAGRVAAASGIPERAVLAYAGAAFVANGIKPGCDIGWNTIAAVGFVESDHARHDGSRLDDTGTAVPPIVGVVLDGGDTANITDSDDGEFDGDTRYDRAVGPMQFIPASWRNWRYDGNADGLTDPQNIDDSAAAAANYLCRASDSDMVSEEGWQAGITAYNSAGGYLSDVAEAAVRYAAAAD